MHGIVVDLADVTFFDARGVRLLRRAREEAIARGFTFTVGRASRIVRTVLEIVDELDLIEDESEPVN